MEWVAQMTIVR